MSPTLRAQTLVAYFDVTYSETAERTPEQEDMYNDTYGSLLALTDSDQVWALRQIELNGRKLSHCILL